MKTKFKKTGLLLTMILALFTQACQPSGGGNPTPTNKVRTAYGKIIQDNANGRFKNTDSEGDSKFEYFYFPDGRIKQIKEYAKDNVGNLYLLRNNTFAYNDAIGEVTLSADGIVETIYTFNPSNKFIISESTPSFGNLLYDYVYNTNGLLTKKSVSIYGTTFDVFSDIQYDDSNNIIQLDYSSNGTNFTTYNFEYNTETALPLEVCGNALNLGLSGSTDEMVDIILLMGLKVGNMGTNMLTNMTSPSADGGYSKSYSYTRDTLNRTNSRLETLHYPTHNEVKEISYTY